MAFLDETGLSRFKTKTDAAYAKASHTHNYAGSSSAGGAATSANKLATARTIALGTAVDSTATSFNGESNITILVTNVKEAYLGWGGKNFSGSYGCIDAAMIPALGANRFAFMPANAIEIQYSTNGGSSWSTYSTSDAAKINLFNGNGNGFTIGASTATGIDKSKYQLRVTITTNTASVYTVLNKFVIYCSTNGSTSSWCSIDAKTKANVDSGTDTWVNFANKVNISGWSGYNIINTSGLTTYGNTSSQYQKIRFTFGVGSHSSSVTYSGLQIIKIMGFGGVGWTCPSNMAYTGHMYTYDASQNTTFPAAVTATSFNGNATSATKATQDSAGQQINTTYIKGLSVSGRTITYTKGDGTTGTITTQDNNTTYSAGAGISLSGTTFSNSGVRSIATGSSNGTISVNTNGTSANVAVKGLGSAAYTNSNAYAAASHTHNYAGSSSAGGVANSSMAINVADTRSVNSAPNNSAFDKGALTADFKQNSTIGSPPGFGGTFSGVLSFAPWSETSGGNGYQLAFGYNSNAHPRLAIRCADLSATSWGTWYKVYTSDDKPTPADIGAAASSHTHTKSQITDFPASLKNPNSLTIKLNGTSQGAYDGSAAKEINITASGVGAAASSHNHGAGNITSGTLDAARIPNLAASKITSGTLAVARGGTASGTIGCLSNGQIAYNIGIRAGTSAPNASGTAGLIYIQYA